MSTRTRTAARRRRPAASRHRRSLLLRRRALLVLGAAALAAAAAIAVLPHIDRAVDEITLPLRHEDIIRQQAGAKELDAALIAAVIYAESRFRDNETSAAGARGLMQVTPATAHDIARRSGGTQFTVRDLATPQVNISYGAYHLRYLLDRYGGNEIFALAAYNAGEGNVDRWIGDARGRDEALTIAAIPFGETRAYVRRVQAARREYRATYPSELGL